MTFEDFCQYFKQLDTCTLVNTSIFSLRKTWHEGSDHGAWAKPERAGGCSNHPTFLKNPQVLSTPHTFLKNPQVLSTPYTFLETPAGTVHTPHPTP